MIKHMTNHLLNNFVEKLRPFSHFQKLTVVSLLLLPIFHLTLNNWTGIFLGLGTLFASLEVIFSKNNIVSKFKERRFYLVLIILLSYSLSILFSQILRFNFSYKAYLDISPFLYFIPIVIALKNLKIDFGSYFKNIIPIVIIGALWSASFNHRELVSDAWGDRITVYFSDPLAFGQMMMTLALISLSNVEIQKNDISDFFQNIWRLLGFCVGMYLSIASGSRSGWLSIPIVFFLLVVLKIKWRLSKSIPLGLLIAFLLSLIIYYLSPFAQVRISEAIQEITNYPWGGGLAPETSVGLRITFQRLGWYYFTQSPISGWGNQGYTAIKDAEPLLNFSTQASRDFVYNALFHNEVMTQMVRYGLFGILGYTGAVILPLILSFRYIKSTNQTVSQSALMCSIFIICQMITGLSDEFLNLKGMVAFYSYIVSLLLLTMLNFSTSRSNPSAQ